MSKSAITVSNPRRIDGEDWIKLTLCPRVDNYGLVAGIVEQILNDKSTFVRWVHEPKSEVWEVILKPGANLAEAAESLADRLNYFLPSNVEAVPEGAIETFADEKLEALLEKARVMKRDIRKLRRKFDKLVGELEEMVG